MTLLQEKILDLKKKKNATILAHNYQTRDIQEVADFVGDSLGLSYQAQSAKSDLIVFCGVHFMAETAKIVNPHAKVLIPDMNAGCSLADSCPAPALEAYKKQHPGLYTVAYINCSAEVKALCDVICTSGNAEKIVNQIPQDREILFVPDQNLGEWVMEKTKRPMKLWQGNCYVHIELTHQSISKIRSEYPDAPIVAHPECDRAVRVMADEVCSTEKMVHYCKSHAAQRFIIATESGMLHRLRREIPNKEFIPGPTDRCNCADCRYMKLNTLEKLLAALETETPELTMTPELIAKARLPIERMLEWSKN
ncbi:MAG: quinolinate synthase NadA [Verrucomicrobiota bacterium]